MAEIRTKPPCSRDDALAVLRRLRELGHTAYFAGGCVRDELLGLAPKDFDVATDAPPGKVRDAFPRTQAVGQAFGVILVRQGQSVVEVATFRSDGRYDDGRRPVEVVFSTPRQDAQRRDFTINGLFLDPLDGDRVIDYVGGVADLKSGILRAIGDPAQRFAEDHLRLLRAVRFAARFGLAIESTTAEAIRRDAPLLKRISPERIADELRLALTARTRTVAWRLLRDFGLGATVFRTPVFPEMSAADESQALFGRILPGEAISFGLAMAACALELFIASGTNDIRPLLQRASARKLTQSLRQTLKLSNDESDEFEQTLESMAPLLHEEAPAVATLKRFRARPVAMGAMALLHGLGELNLHSARINLVLAQLAELEGEECAPPPLVTGDDLTAAGLAPGPAFKRILESVYDAQLELRVADKDQAMTLAMGLAAARE